MVHNLRTRNICGTSDKLRTINGRKRFVHNINLKVPHAPLGEMLDKSTPLLYTPSVSLVAEIQKCSDPIGNTSTPKRFRSSFLTSTRVDNGVVSSDSGAFTSSWIHDFNHAPTTQANKSSYEKNICTAVDEAIFSKTYKTAKGLSLSGIRSFLGEFGYDPKKCHNKVRLYVRECIENCRFVQVSGRGARGSFRLNKPLHTSFIRAHKTGRITKDRNVGTSVYRRRFKQHDTDMLSRMLKQADALCDDQ